MSYHLFLDDDRFPADDGIPWIIVRTVRDAIWTVERHGMPVYITFDHDLGPPPEAEGFEGTSEAMRFAHWLKEHILDTQPDLSGFAYYVHSQNPIGRTNIVGLMDPLIAHARAGYR